jgi:hypothetical protein
MHLFALPDFTVLFTMETNACKCGVGVQQGHLVAYLSKALGPIAQMMSTYEKECLGILLDVDKWWYYLQHAPFTIITDQRSLVHLSDQKLTSDICIRKLSSSSWACNTNCYIAKEKENSAADALYCQPRPPEQYKILLCRPCCLETVVEGYKVASQAQTLLHELSLVSPNNTVYSLHQSLICYKDRIWLGNNTNAHQAIMLSLHDSGIGGHSGFLGTYQRIK